MHLACAGVAVDVPPVTLVRRSRVVATALATGVIGAGLALSYGAADASGGVAAWSSVPTATDARGVTTPKALPPGLTEHPVAQGP